MCATDFLIFYCTHFVDQVWVQGFKSYNLSMLVVWTCWLACNSPSTNLCVRILSQTTELRFNSCLLWRQTTVLQLVDSILYKWDCSMKRVCWFKRHFIIRGLFENNYWTVPNEIKLYSFPIWQWNTMPSQGSKFRFFSIFSVWRSTINNRDLTFSNSLIIHDLS